MNRRLFVDTSAWMALANGSDPDHRATRDVLESFRGALVTSNFVLDETLTLCRHRLGWDAALRVGEQLRGQHVAEVARATPDDENLAWELFRERSDRRSSFTDCVSFVMMRRLGIDSAAALDDDFEREGFAVVP